MGKSSAGQMTTWANVPEAYRKVREDGNQVIFFFDPKKKGKSIGEKKVAQVWLKYPKDGAGILKVVGISWGPDSQTDAAWFYDSAGGYGYDKQTLALAGFSFFNAAGKVITLSAHGSGLTLSNLHSVGIETLSGP